MTYAYQVHQGPLDQHQMTLITNLTITNYKNKGLINLLALCSDLISFYHNRYNSFGMNLLLCHSL